MSEEVKLILAEGGRIAIPASYQEAMGIQPGDEVILRLEEGQVRILTARRPSGEPQR